MCHAFSFTQLAACMVLANAAHMGLCDAPLLRLQCKSFWEPMQLHPAAKPRLSGDQNQINTAQQPYLAKQICMSPVNSAIRTHKSVIAELCSNGCGLSNQQIPAYGLRNHLPHRGRLTATVRQVTKMLHMFLARFPKATQSQLHVQD